MPLDVISYAAAKKAQSAAAARTFPIIDPGSGYPARPPTGTIPAGLALYKGPSQPADGQVGDEWEPTYSTARRVIIDTDFYTDVDDCVAMRLAAYYEKTGKFDVLGCIVDTAGPAGAPALESFWRNSESRPMLVGQVDGSHSDLTSQGTYEAYLNTLPHYGGTDASVFPDSNTTYRTLLAAAPDNSVDIISIGYLSALWWLLLSPGDSIDSRTGLQLVAAKVRHLWVMGGGYPGPYTENNFSRSAQTILAANYVVANWPAPTGWTTGSAPYVTFSGYEVGATVISGGNLVSQAASNDVLLGALTAYNTAQGQSGGRASWDPLCVQLAALGATAAGYTTVRGTNVVNASTGANTFTGGSTGPHRYVVKAQSDASFQTSINTLLVPGRRPEPLTGIQTLRSDGLWTPQSWKDRQNGRLTPVLTGNTDLGSTLVASFRASDLALSDAAAIATAPAHGGGPTWVGPTGKQPVYRTSVFGRACAQFSGAQVLDTASNITGASSMTIYARVLWTTLPSAIQSPVGMDNGGSQRQFHLSATAAGTVAQGNGFANSAANQPGATAGATLIDTATGLIVNTWHLLTLRITGAGAEMFIDLASDGPGAISPAGYFPTVATIIAEIGAWTNGGTLKEPMTGYVAGVDVFTGAHSPAKMATIAAGI